MFSDPSLARDKINLTASLFLVGGIRLAQFVEPVN